MGNFSNKVKGFINVAKVKMKEASPEICLVVGIGAGVATVGLAIYETLHAEEKLHESKENIQFIKDKKTDAEESSEDSSEYPATEYRKDLAAAYAHGAKEIVKLYWPAMATGSVSVACLLASHNLLKKRNAALVTAYNVLDKAFREYRSRVLEKYGEEAEEKIRLGIKDVEFEEVDEKGKSKKIKEKVSESLADPYTFYFDQFSSTQWDRDELYNENLFQEVETRFSSVLKYQKYVWLNDILEVLGLEPVEYGYDVGWYYNAAENHIEDNYINLRVKKGKRICPDLAQTDSCYKDYPIDTYILTMNCDGNIRDRVWKKNKKYNHERHCLNTNVGPIWHKR